MDGYLLRSDPMDQVVTSKNLVVFQEFGDNVTSKLQLFVSRVFVDKV